MVSASRPRNGRRHFQPPGRHGGAGVSPRHLVRTPPLNQSLARQEESLPSGKASDGGAGVRSSKVGKEKKSVPASLIHDRGQEKWDICLCPPPRGPSRPSHRPGRDLCCLLASGASPCSSGLWVARVGACVRSCMGPAPVDATHVSPVPSRRTVSGAAVFHMR